MNGKPLLAGGLVPDRPFEIQWQADGCRPFGTHGPSYDGRVKLTVFREDWGFSAMVEPLGLRIVSVENEVTVVQPSAVSMPQSAEVDNPVRLTTPCAYGVQSCL